MNTISTTFARILCLVTMVGLAGCDDADDEAFYGADDQEFRTLGLEPDPGFGKVVARVPMYPAVHYSPGTLPWSDPGIHSGYDISSGAVVNAAGGTMYTFDDNDLLPFGTHTAALSQNQCIAFENDFSAVPIAESADLSYCAAVEQGCCSFICKAWGGKVDTQDRVGFVDQDSMIEPIYETFVAKSNLLSWDNNDPYQKGGLNRDRACACNCDG